MPKTVKDLETDVVELRKQVTDLRDWVLVMTDSVIEMNTIQVGAQGQIDAHSFTLHNLTKWRPSPAQSNLVVTRVHLLQREGIDIVTQDWLDASEKCQNNKEFSALVEQLQILINKHCPKRPVKPRNNYAPVG